MEGNAYAYASDVAQELRADVNANAARGHPRPAAASVAGIKGAFLVLVSSCVFLLFSTSGFQGREHPSAMTETGVEMCVSQKFLLQRPFLLSMPAPTRVSVPSTSPPLSGEG
jgi:hypothetical protein